MAFGTSSSAAALPLAMQAAKGGGCDAAVVDFFLPLGKSRSGRVDRGWLCVRFLQGPAVVTAPG